MRGYKLNFYKISLVLIILLGSLLQHIVHECSHILVAKFNGIKIIKVQWLTYPRFLMGTRVFYDNEPELGEKDIESKWGWVAIAGLITTTFIGYIIIISYLLFSKYMSHWLIIIVCLFSMIFLINDPLYFVLGSLFGFGDVKGVRRAFGIQKSISILFSIIIFIFNILLIKFIWYSS